MPRSGNFPLAHVKRTTAKGRTYYYFNTGKKDESGKTIFTPLPSPRDPSFGGKYAALLGHRNRAPAAPVMSVAKLVALYQGSSHYAGLALASRRLYDTYLAQFMTDFGPGEAARLERQDIALAVDNRASTPGAANMYLKTVRALYKWARGRGHLTNRPGDDIELMDLGEHEPWPDDLLEKALACDDAQVRLAVHLLYYTAQRVSDVVRIRWDDIREGVVYVRQGKTFNRTRIEMQVPLHSALATELEKAERAGATIITNQDGKAVGRERVLEWLQAWASARGREVVTHGLRKNAVNALLEAGCSIPQAAAISGQSFQMVAHYAKRRNQQKLSKAAIRKWQKSKA